MDTTDSPPSYVLDPAQYEGLRSLVEAGVVGLVALAVVACLALGVLLVRALS